MPTSKVENLETQEHQEMRSLKTGEIYSRSAVLTEKLEFKSLFVHHEVIEPGRRSSGRHSHTEREEMVLVLEGKVIAKKNDKSLILGPGDFVGFLPGEIHVIENQSEASAKVLVIASNPLNDAVRYQE